MNQNEKNKLTQSGNGETQELVVRADFGEVFVKQTEEGHFLRPVKAKLPLLESAGHFYWISGNYAISAAGYVHLNKVASINLVTPKTISVDGVEQPNPYVERNRKTKVIETVNVRKIGIGFSPMGNITVVDKSLFYNCYTYFIESIRAKMKKKKQGSEDLLYPDCAFIGTKFDKPGNKSGKWAFYEIASPLGIWVDYTHEAIISCIDDHTQRQRFGDRIAQKIVERNILKDHPAIGVSQVEDVSGEQKKRKGYATVYGYRHEFGPREINDIADQAERGSQEIEVKAEVLKVDPEEENKIIKEAADEEEFSLRRQGAENGSS